MLILNRKGVMAVLLSQLIGLSLAVFGQQRDTAPIKFSLRSLDGETVTDADVRGKVAVFIISSIRLPVENRQAVSLRNLVRDYAPRGVVFYLVSTDSESLKSKYYASDAQLRQFASELDLPLKVLRDPGGENLKRHSKDLIPLIVVLDRQGRVDGQPVEGYGEASLGSILRPQLARLTR
jgi:peroxiredoxin